MFENIGKSLQKLFGSKQEKDILKFNPIIEQIHQFGDNLKNLSHDELRQKTTEFRERISDYLSDIDDAIENLRQQTIDSEELSDKENLFLEIDTLKKQRDQELEVILNEILPEAFAVVKETAIRFKNNSTLSVTATEHDKNPDLAKNLKGKLLLIHGEIDNNVHPANTLRVVNALIKANKRFDMLILPTQRHGFGDMNEYWFWRTADYFSKYLLGDNTERSVDIDELNRDVERKK